MAGSLSPWVKPQFFDSNGDPLSGGFIYSYEAGTSTPLATYSDVALATPNTNPIVLDAAGRATIFLSTSSYKFVAQNSAAVEQWSQDNISIVPVSTGTANVAITGTAGEALTAGNCVYCSDGSGGLTAGRWYKTSSANTYSSTAAGEVGFASANISSAASGEIILAGRVTGLAGLTVGAIHYIAATPGAISNSAPTNARAVAVADSTSTIVVSPWALSAGTARFAGTLTSVGAFSAAAAATVGTTLGVTGATTLSSTLSAGASTLASLAVTAGATVGTTLGVTGATTLSSTLSAGASTLASVGVTGAATVGTTLGVTGATTLSSTVGIAGQLSLTSSAFTKTGTKTLTAAAATGFVRIACAQGARVGGLCFYSIEADDATDYQIRTGVLPWAIVNKAGTETGAIATVDTATETVAVSAGTLTNTFTITSNAADTMDLEANAASSLSETTLRINYTVIITSNAAVTVTAL